MEEFHVYRDGKNAGDWIWSRLAASLELVDLLEYDRMDTISTDSMAGYISFISKQIVRKRNEKFMNDTISFGNNMISSSNSPMKSDHNRIMS